MLPDILTLLQYPNIRRADTIATRKSIPTGFIELDRMLPEAGWPRGEIIEWVLPRLDPITAAAAIAGGSLRLMGPLLKAMTRDNLWVVLLAPPAIPYPWGWRSMGVKLERLLICHPPDQQAAWWGMEQILRNPQVGVAVFWSSATEIPWRRWKLAAKQGDNFGIVIHSEAAWGSAVSLRLAIHPHVKGIEVEVLKSRGIPCEKRIFIQ